MLNLLTALRTHLKTEIDNRRAQIEQGQMGNHRVSVKEVAVDFLRKFDLSCKQEALQILNFHKVIPQAAHDIVRLAQTPSQNHDYHTNESDRLG